jgi:hypothetical protein
LAGSSRLPRRPPGRVASHRQEVTAPFVPLCTLRVPSNAFTSIHVTLPRPAATKIPVKTTITIYPKATYKITLLQYFVVPF